jgi:NADH:ubiquinone oxidoreductase subunit 6 (subunit J)
MERCRYCSAPVDQQSAATAAEIQSKVNMACSDASFLRTAAATVFVLLGLSLLPFISLITYLGSIFIFLAVLVMVIRWQIKFGSLQTGDPDYQRAKRLKNISLLLWFLAIPVFLVREIVGAVISRMM